MCVYNSVWVGVGVGVADHVISEEGHVTYSLTSLHYLSGCGQSCDFSGKSCDSSTFTFHILQQAYTIQLSGRGWSSSMYALGGESTGPGEESMAAIVPPPGGQPPPPHPLLVVFVCHVREGGGSAITREVEVGCIKTALVKKVGCALLIRLLL